MRRFTIAFALILAAATASAGGKDTLPKNWFPADQAGTMRIYPRELLNYLMFEQHYNLWIKNNKEYQALGDFSPGRRKVFTLPYFLIPAEEMGFAFISAQAKEATVKHLIVDVGGKPHVRYFFHPFTPNDWKAYNDMFARYQIGTEYVAMASASPRSLVVMNTQHPDWGPLWVKVSLHVEIDGSLRTQNKQKSRRAVLVGGLYNEIPEPQQRERRFSYLPEVASFLPARKNMSTVIREIPTEIYDESDKYIWLPALALAGSGSKDETPLFWMVINKNFLDHVDEFPLAANGGPFDSIIRINGIFDGPQKILSFFREGLFRPLLRTYAYLAFIEGLQGEFHTQNYLYQIDRGTGLPTGKVIMKDMDGHRVDMELRLRFHRTFATSAGIDEPYEYAKYTSAIGKGLDDDGKPEPAFLGEYYAYHIRSIKGFNTIAQIANKVCSDYFKMERIFGACNIEGHIDEVLADEVNKLFQANGVALQTTKEQIAQYGLDNNGNPLGLNLLTAKVRVLKDAEAVNARAKNGITAAHPFKQIFDREVKYLVEHRRNSAVQYGFLGSGKNADQVLDGIYYLYHAAERVIEVRKQTKEGGVAKDRMNFFCLLEPTFSRNSQEFTQALREQRWPQINYPAPYDGFTSDTTSFMRMIRKSVPFGEMTLPRINPKAAAY